MAGQSNFLFKLDLVILSVLKHNDMYAYEMIKYIASITNDNIILKHGTMYPIINTLIENECITSRNEIHNNKIRVYYHLEEKGIHYLNELTKTYDQLVKDTDLIVHGGAYHR